MGAAQWPPPTCPRLGLHERSTSAGGPALLRYVVGVLLRAAFSGSSGRTIAAVSTPRCHRASASRPARHENSAISCGLRARLTGSINWRRFVSRSGPGRAQTYWQNLRSRCQPLVRLPLRTTHLRCRLSGMSDSGTTKRALRRLWPLRRPPTIGRSALNPEVPVGLDDRVGDVLALRGAQRLVIVVT